MSMQENKNNNGRLRDLFEEIEIPIELEPQNIALMLRNIDVDKAKKENRKEIKSITVNKNAKFNRKKGIEFYSRTVATAAACLIVVLGVTVYFARGNEGLTPVETKETVATSAGSYDEVYAAIQKAYVESTTSNNQLNEIIIEAEKEEANPVVVQETIPVLNTQYNGAAVHEINDIYIDFYSQEMLEDATIIPQKLVNYQGFIYYISNNAVNVFDCTSEEIVLVSNIEREDITPIGLYIKDGNLVLVSENTTEVKKEKLPEQTVDTVVDSSDVMPEETTEAVNPNLPSQDLPLEGAETSTETGASSEESSSETSLDETSETPDTTETSDTAESEVEAELPELPTDGLIDEMESSSESSSIESETESSTNSIVDEALYEYVEVNNVLVEVFDLSSPSTPNFIRQYEQDGDYLDSVMIGEHIYISSKFTDSDLTIIKNTEEIEKYVPSYTIDGVKTYVKPEDIVSAPKLINTNYIVISGVDITSEVPTVGANAMLGYSSSVKFIDDSVYFYANNTESQEVYLSKATLVDGDILQTVITTLTGVIKNSSFIDENDNVTTIITSSYSEENDTFTNILFNLSDDLSIFGQLNDFGTTKMISSVKFDGTIVYCMTDDDLNTIIPIDCSNAALPTIYNNAQIESTVPEFYNIGEDVFVALGESKDENNLVNGIKLSLFQKDTAVNTFDEVASYILTETFAESETQPHIYADVIYVDKEAGLIGISVNYFGGIDYANKFYMFAYQEDGTFTQVGVVDSHNVEKGYEFTRAIKNNNTLFLISENEILSCSYSTMAVISTAKIK